MYKTKLSINCYRRRIKREIFREYKKNRLYFIFRCPFFLLVTRISQTAGLKIFSGRV